MHSRLFASLVLSILAGSWAYAQSSDDDDGSLADRSPAQNVRGGAVRDRAPGNIINAARQRHGELINARVNAGRNGQAAGVRPEGGDTDGSAGGGTDSGDSGSIDDLLNSIINSGLLGALGGGGLDLGGLLGGLGGSSTGASTNTNSTEGSEIPSDLPSEVTDAIENAGIDLNQQKADARSQSADTADKTSLRAQTADDEEPRFAVRWGDAMLQRTFAGLVLLFQTPDFIDLLADWLRPIFIPPADESGESGDGSDSDGDGDGDSVVRLWPAAAAVV